MFLWVGGFGIQAARLLGFWLRVGSVEGVWAWGFGFRGFRLHAQNISGCTQRAVAAVSPVTRLNPQP